MSSIQGIQSTPTAAYTAPKTAAAKPEARETAQVERQEASQGTPEPGEARPGSRFSATA
jgi:hypothetical protein